MYGLARRPLCRVLQPFESKFDQIASTRMPGRMDILQSEKDVNDVALEIIPYTMKDEIAEIERTLRALSGAPKAAGISMAHSGDARPPNVNDPRQEL